MRCIDSAWPQENQGVLNEIAKSSGPNPCFDELAMAV
jgi:hypothetical protein